MQKRKEDRARVRAQLEAWANVPMMVKQLQDEIEDYAAAVEHVLSPKATQYDKQPGGGGVGDPTAAQAAKYERYMAWAREQTGILHRRMEQYQRYAAEVERCIALLPSLECKVVLLRYREYGGVKSGYWGKIARRVHVSEDYAKELEGKAVDRLSGRLPELPPTEIGTK